MTRAIVDGALILRAASAAAETATADSAGLAVDFLPHTHPLNSNSIANDDGSFRAVIHNIVLAGTVAPTAVTFVIKAAAAADMSGAKEVARSVMNDLAQTRIEIYLSYYSIRRVLATAAALCVGVIIAGGTAPTVDYECFLTKE